MSKKTVLVVGLVAVALFALLWLGARPALRHYREEQALAQARKFLAAKDARNASLSAQRVLALDPGNVEACRVMATVAEAVGAPEALDWFRKVAEMSPTVENKLALAAAALRVQPSPYPLASKTLGELAAVAKDRPAYHLISADLALKLNRPREAEAEFEAASRLEPTNLLHRLNIAALRLQSSNQTVVAEARVMLENLRRDWNAGVAATRWLAADAFARKDMETARDLSVQLLADPRATMADRLQHLDILGQMRSPDFAQAVAETQKVAMTNGTTIYAVSSWMVSRDLASQAMEWLTNLPAAVQAEQSVAMAKTDCLIAAKDWPGVVALLEGQKWGESDFMRLAFLSRAAGEQKNTEAAQGYWRLAVQQANDRLGPLTSLLTMATAWGRESARQELLARIVEKYPVALWAFRELEQAYLKAGNTRGLNGLYAAIVANNPTDMVAKNNLAATGLLAGIDLAKAEQSAADLYREHPEEPIVVSTYALSLHVQGRDAEGLAALERLKPEALQSPAIALYYALLLDAQGQKEKAASYAAAARQAVMLPEEKELMSRLARKE
jgi:predicted Zn-dependent protease